MGRAPKYKTNAEKVTANSLKCKRYRQTPRYAISCLISLTYDYQFYDSGKDASRKHKRKTAKTLKPTTSFPGLPRLSQDLINLAALPLPTHELGFQDATQGVVDEAFLHECRVGVWGKRPPFPDNDDARSTGDSVETVQQWMLGFWYRDLDKENARRRAGFHQSPEDARRLLQEEIQGLLAGFKALQQINYEPGTPQHSMLQSWMRLDALQIVHLYHMKFLT